MILKVHKSDGKISNTSDSCLIKTLKWENISKNFFKKKYK